MGSRAGSFGAVDDPTMSTQPRPIAPVIAMRTNGAYVNAVEVRCSWCCSTHWHSWNNETDSFRYPPCQAGAAAYTVTVDTRARMDHMRTEYPAPNGVVGLVPLNIHYAYEQDDDEDIIGVVLETALGAFAVWLPVASAVGLAGQLVEIVEKRDELRAAYVQRLENGSTVAARASNTVGVV